jgi:hypothetical protein
VGLGFLIVEVSRSHSDKPHSVRLLWTSVQLAAENSTWQYTTLHALGGIRTRNPSKRAATFPHFRPRGRCHLQHYIYIHISQRRSWFRLLCDDVQSFQFVETILRARKILQITRCVYQLYVITQSFWVWKFACFSTELHVLNETLRKKQQDGDNCIMTAR